MPILSGDDYIAAQRDLIRYLKTVSRTASGAGWISIFDQAGVPGAGTLGGTSTTAGVVPTDATAGAPGINAFAGGATGYLTRVDFANTIACRMRVFDMVWKGGAYAFNANQALSAQPSYSARMPGGSYKGTEIWVEQVTAATGNLAVNVTYTNQDGVGSRTTGATGIGAAPPVGRMFPLPLQAGDTGVQRIDNVAGSVASAGTFNVLVLRPLWSGRVPIAQGGDTHDLFKTGAPVVFADSCLVAAVYPDSTSSGIPDLMLEIASK